MLAKKKIRCTVLFLAAVLHAQAGAQESDYELRAGYGILSTQKGGIAVASGITGEVMRGFVVTALLVSPFSWVDFGLQFEHLSNAVSSSNYQATANRFGFVFEKEFHLGIFFFAPTLVGNFVNAVQYFDSSGNPALRANATVSGGAGATLGLRLKGFGLSIEAGYRRALLTYLFNAVTAVAADPSVYGGYPDWSGVYTNICATVWF